MCADQDQSEGGTVLQGDGEEGEVLIAGELADGQGLPQKILFKAQGFGIEHGGKAVVRASQYVTVLNSKEEGRIRREGAGERMEAYSDS